MYISAYIFKDYNEDFQDVKQPEKKYVILENAEIQNKEFLLLQLTATLENNTGICFVLKTISHPVNTQIGSALPCALQECQSTAI